MTQVIALVRLAPASVPDAASIPAQLMNNRQKSPLRGLFVDWWRRRESNPRPRMIRKRLYVRIQAIFVSSRA